MQVDDRILAEVGRLYLENVMLRAQLAVVEAQLAATIDLAEPAVETEPEQQGGDA